MKILFLTDNFYPETNAPAKRTLEHCKEWVNLDHEITVITGVPNFPKGKVEVFDSRGTGDHFSIIVICDSFKEELLEGTHDLDGHTLKMALYTSSATLGSTTTAYSTTNESSGTNYTAGGATISSVTVAKSTSTTYVDFADVSWSSATISDAAGALIYNSSASNKAIAVIDFGATKSVTSGTLTVTLPANSASAAIIRLK